MFLKVSDRNGILNKSDELVEISTVVSTATFQISFAKIEIVIHNNNSVSATDRCTKGYLND
jgi:oligoribonuclease (3'-5' exoribonuclease)